MTSHWLEFAVWSQVAAGLFHVVWFGALVGVVTAVLNGAGRSVSPSVRCGWNFASLVLLAASLPFAVGWILANGTNQFAPNVTDVDVLRKPELPAEAFSESGGKDETNSLATRRDSSGEPSPAEQAHTAGEPTHRGRANGTSRAAFATAFSMRSIDVEGWTFVAAPWLTIAYVAGFVWMMGRLAVGSVASRRIQLHADVITHGTLFDRVGRIADRLSLRVVPALASSGRIAVPAVVGVFRPVVLIPAVMLSGLTADELANIMLHELSHIRRHDHRLVVVQRLCEAIVFFHPATWYLSRCIRDERERCCDDMALRIGGDRIQYASSLLRVAELRVAGDALRLGRLTSLAADGDRPSRLRRRIARLLGEPSPPSIRWNGASLFAGTLLSAVAVCVAAYAIWAGDGAVRKESRKPNSDETGSGKTRDREDAGRSQSVAGNVSATPGDDEGRAAREWSQWGGGPLRNNVSDATGLPTDWNAADSSNVRWSADLGSQSFASPIVAGGRVLIGTNNGAGRIGRFAKEIDLACLQCFDLASGKFLWQYSSEKLSTGRAHDWPQIGLCSTPCVIGDRAWFVTNRAEVVCVDMLGFHDGQNDGPFRREESTDRDEADVVWRFDMMKSLGVSPHQQSCSSVTVAGDLVLLNTGNGVDESHRTIPAPEAPSFVALNRRTGKKVWTHNPVGKNILAGDWSSPAVADIDGVRQAIFAGGDGWLYAYDLESVGRGETNLRWRFDCNPKMSRYVLGSAGTRNRVIGAPVVVGHRVFVTVGQNPEVGEGPGRIWCIDATKRGDVSSELVFNRADPTRPIPHKRLQACEPEKGDFVAPNPNSGAIWSYESFDVNGDGEISFDETMHRSCASAAIAEGLLFVADFSGILHCVDVETGRPYWTHDLFAAVWNSPCIADGKVYVADEDGDVAVFRLSRKKTLIAESSLGSPIIGTPAAVHGMLLINSKTKMFALGRGGDPPAENSRRSDETDSPAGSGNKTVKRGPDDEGADRNEASNADEVGSARRNRVVDAQGKGIAGATVELRPYRIGEKDPAFAQTKADEQGWFDYPPETPDKGHFLVDVSASGFVASSSLGNHRVHVMRGGKLVPDTFQLDRAVTIRGRVIGANGEPLAGLPLGFDFTRANGSAAINARRFESGNDGRFELTDLPAGDLFIRYERRSRPTDTPRNEAPYGEAEMAIVHLIANDGATIDDVVIDLRESACELGGRLLDVNGDGIAGAEIRIALNVSSHRLDHSVRTVTDEDGRFRVAGLPPQEFEIRASKRDLGLGERTVVKLSRETPTDVTLRGYTLAQAPPAERKEKLVWGREHRGLQAALFVEPVRDSYKVGDVFNVRAVVRNVGDEPADLTDTWSFNRLHIVGPEGTGQAFDFRHFTGLPWSELYRIEPGHEVQLKGTFNIQVMGEGDTGGGSAMFGWTPKPGETYRLVVSFGDGFDNDPAILHDLDASQRMISGEIELSVSQNDAAPVDR